MTEDAGVVRRIVWNDIFPGLLLLRCFRMAVSLPILTLATAGTLLMPVGPWLRDKMVGPPAAVRVPEGAEASSPLIPSPTDWPLAKSAILKTWRELQRPWVGMFDSRASLEHWLGNALVAAWQLGIWSLLGGAITRIAVVDLGRRERVTWEQAGRHVARNAAWYLTSPLFPLLGVVLLAVPVAILGLFMRMSFGVFLAGLLWPLVLIAGFLMTVLLTGALFGWPLMWPTISAEKSSDAFQAFSNSFSYVFQRPLSYLAYAVLASVIGSLGALLVEGFGHMVVAMNYWAVSFGLGSENLATLLSQTSRESWLQEAGVSLITWANQLVEAVTAAYSLAYFFCAMSAIYLLLRREVDQTDFDEVYLPEEGPVLNLPKTRPGPYGIPELESPGETPAGGT